MREKLQQIAALLNGLQITFSQAKNAYEIISILEELYESSPSEEKKQEETKE